MLRRGEDRSAEGGREETMAEVEGEEERERERELRIHGSMKDGLLDLLASH